MCIRDSVYSNKGGVELERLASLLLSALAANPHNVEAWDVLFAHFRATTLTSKVLLNEAYRVFKPVASLYPSTYEALLGAIATNFVCDASAGAGGVLPWLLSEIEQTAEACETPMRVALKIAILPCLQGRQWRGSGRSRPTVRWACRCPCTCAASSREWRSR